MQNDYCIVQICVDSTYTVQSVDNRHYNIVLNPGNYGHSDFYKTFRIHIDLFYDIIDIALIGDFYSYDTDCAYLDGEVLTVMQNDTISQLKVTDGTLILYKKFDCFGCNYGLYRVSNGYIVYGEIEITMLDWQFEKKWSFSGRDIFVSHTEKKSFEICEDLIHLYDWNDNYYELTLDGKLICDRPVHT